MERYLKEAIPIKDEKRKEAQKKLKKYLEESIPFLIRAGYITIFLMVLLLVKEIL